MLGSLFCYELGVEAGIVAGIGIPVVAGGVGVVSLLILTLTFKFVSSLLIFSLRPTAAPMLMIFGEERKQKAS